MYTATHLETKGDWGRGEGRVHAFEQGNWPIDSKLATHSVLKYINRLAYTHLNRIIDK